MAINPLKQGWHLIVNLDSKYNTFLKQTLTFLLRPEKFQFNTRVLSIPLPLTNSKELFGLGVEEKSHTFFHVQASSYLLESR